MPPLSPPPPTQADVVAWMIRVVLPFFITEERRFEPANESSCVEKPCDA